MQPNKHASITFMRLPVGKIERTLKVLPGCADILFGGTVMLEGMYRFDLYRRGESTFTSPPPRQHQPHAIGDNLCLKTPPLLKPRPVPWPPPQNPSPKTK